MAGGTVPAALIHQFVTARCFLVFTKISLLLEM